MKKTQREMCEDAILSPARRFHAFMAIMNGPNPMTDDEMIKMAETYPDRYGFMKAYVGKFKNNKERDLYDLIPALGEMYGEVHEATGCCIAGWGCFIASITDAPGSGKIKTDPIMVRIHEEGFRIDVENPKLDGQRELAKNRCYEWLQEVAKERGLRLVTTEVVNGKVKLVLW